MGCTCVGVASYAHLNGLILLLSEFAHEWKWARGVVGSAITLVLRRLGSQHAMAKDPTPTLYGPLASRSQRNDLYTLRSSVWSRRLTPAVPLGAPHRTTCVRSFLRGPNVRPCAERDREADGKNSAELAKQRAGGCCCLGGSKVKWNVPLEGGRTRSSW